MASYLGNSPDVILQVRKRNYRYVATGGQNTFSGNDSNGQSLSVNTADVEVFLNGVLLDQTDYTITSTQLQLTLNAALDDIVEIITNTTFASADQYSKSEVDSKVATAVTDLVGTAGAALNTLGELSDALNDDANFASTVTTALAAKANSSDVTTALSLKSNISTTVTKDSSTGAATMPVGTTAQRPASPISGMFRLNSTSGTPEWYDAITDDWFPFSERSVSYQVEYLIVAGGGGGATDADVGGGGGAGGYLSGTSTITTNTSYSVVVGAGGTGGTSNYTPGTGAGGNGTQGSNSSALGLIAIGGGYGGTRNNAGGAGGSGGGGGDFGSAGGAGTAGQGFAGGTAPGLNTNGGWDQGGGGGAGGAANSWIPGPGVSNSISGSAVIYAKGGSGSAGTNNQGVQAPANTGQGGRGGATTADTTGGSGIVIIRYFGAQRATGGSITSTSGYTIHTFTSSGTFAA
jgi:hypothetical protein